jgi:hypothetical protein
LVGGLQVSNETLLEGLREAVGVWYNYTGADRECFDPAAGPNNETKLVAHNWDYQFCKCPRSDGTVGIVLADKRMDLAVHRHRDVHAVGQ